MSERSPREVVGQIRALFVLGAAGSLSDEQLLDRFVARRDETAEAAFAVLVQRHGPMVLGVCRRWLHDRHEAEDAFQATFLVLARKAATLARRERLANWLYGVACRTAKEARHRAARRQARERIVMTHSKTAVDPGPSDGAHDLRSVLDEELKRLPERLRAVVVLCELEGLTRSAAALRLGIPEGTLSSRLARAKAQLRDRLTRRGLALSLPALMVATSRDAPAATVPTRLIETTVQAAAQVATGTAANAVVTASVASLTEGVIKTMFLAKLKGIGFGLLSLGVVTAGAVLAQEDPAPEAAPAPSADKPVAILHLPPSADNNYVVLRTESGLAVFTQDPNTAPKAEPPPTAAPESVSAKTEAERMETLESKLDRILEALERSRPAVVYSMPATAPPSPTPAVPSPAPDSADRQPAAVPTRIVIPEPLSRASTIPPGTHVSPPVRPTQTRSAAPKPITERLDSLEKRLSTVEKRISELTRMLEGTKVTTPGPNSDETISEEVNVRRF